MTEFYLPKISPVSKSLSQAIQEKIDSKTKPLGSLGNLEAIAFQIANIQNTLSPNLNHPILTLFAADHGVTEEGVSAYPKEVTWQMVLNFLNGGACSNVFAKFNQIDIEVVDAGVDHKWDQSFPNLHERKIGAGTHNFKNRPAMDKHEAERAIEQGFAWMKEERFHDSSLVLFGEMGIGNTSAASIILSCLTGLPLDVLTGRGTGIDEKAKAHKLEILKQAMARGGNPKDPFKILTEYGGFEIAMMAGAIYYSAYQKKIIIIDGFIATAAFALAHAMSSSVQEYCIFSHQSDEAGHKHVLDYYKVSPLLSLKLRLGEGTGALAAYPLVAMSLLFFNEMASFASANVSDKSE
jgi:nicotinate-nucleotide--dimethylbenzimidazole phosphoribosyltransferase